MNQVLAVMPVPTLSPARHSDHPGLVRNDGGPALVAGSMRIEVWSDVVCPWCYIGKRHLEAALGRFAHADQVEVVWRAFELDPHAPATTDPDYVGRLAGKYGRSRDEAQGMLDTMTARAAEAGLDFRFDLARPGNTLAAHRLLHAAAEHGLQGELKERLLRATFTEGEPVADADTLVRLAVDVGLDADEARAVVEGDAYLAQVRAEEAEAAALGATGVPFFVVDRRYGVAGAQPVEALLEVLERAWSDAQPLVAVGGPGPGCDGDSCSV